MIIEDREVVNVPGSQNVLIFQRSANRDGSAISGLMIARGLVTSGHRVDVFFGHAGDILRDYEELGCNCVVNPHGDWLRPGGPLKSARRIARELLIGVKLSRTLRRRKIDLVYVNSLVSMSGAVAAKRLGVPCVWHIRELFSDVGGEMYIPAIGGKRLVRAFVDRLASEVVVNSNAVKENVCGDVLSSRASVVCNAVSAANLDFGGSGLGMREELGIARDAFVIGVPSTLRPMKGQLEFLDAFQKLVSTSSHFQLVLLGDTTTEYAASVIQRVSNLGLNARVHFAGMVQDMGKFYRACDLVVLPSVAEPFGRVAIEAFFSSVPVVATAVGGLKEIIRHNDNGLLVPYEDVDAMVDSILRLASDTQLRDRLVSSAKADALHKYTESGYGDAVMNVIERALGKCG